MLINETQSTLERALIVKEEWIERIFAGLKTWEMRSTKTKFRGRFGLISSGSGLIVGEVSLMDSLGALDPENFNSFFDQHAISAERSELLNKYKYPWVLNSPQKYMRPVQYRHPLGAVIWVKLDASVLV